MEGMPLIINDYLDYLSSVKGKSQSTIKEYYYDLRTFFRFLKRRYNIDTCEQFNDILIDDIDEAFIDRINLRDLYAYISFLEKEKGNNNKSKARKIASLKSFFKYMHAKLGIIKSNPTLELESPKLDSRHPIYLDLEESKKLLAAVEGKHKERDYAIITLFLNCGLRLSELASIDIERIKNDTITVIGKGSKERTIYLNNACNKALDYYFIASRQNYGYSGPLFMSERGQRISTKTIQYIVKKYIKKAGLDSRFSTHKLRHTAATLMYLHGNVDIRALQQILGHQNISTTQIYTHVDDERLRKAVKNNPLSNI